MAEPGEYTYRFPRPMVTVDALVFSTGPEGRQILLIERKHDPFGGRWALPGGFVEMDETLEAAVSRELEEETGVRDVALRQLHTFSKVDRDPRGRSISTAFVGETEAGAHTPAGADDAADARWFPLGALPPLAFDHGEIIEYALRRDPDAL